MTGAEKPARVMIIGSGPIVIGQAAEFDYAGTQACKSLREEGITTILVNSNPATIMTDEEIADVVYIEPLNVEVLTRIIEQERPDGLLPTLGGQTGLNLAVALADAGVLERYNVRLLGTPLDTIKKAEDRELFKQLLISIGEPVPPSAVVNSIEEARAAVAQIGLPVAIRPAYTLGGTGGGFASTPEEFERICASGLAASPIHQVLVEQSLLGWKELEYEIMRDSAGNCITICNMENIDPMGVHTGDSIVVAPSQTLSDRDHQMLRSASLKIIRALGVEGGCNVQFALAPRNDVVPWMEGSGEDPPVSPLLRRGAEPGPAARRGADDDANPLRSKGAEPTPARTPLRRGAEPALRGARGAKTARTPLWNRGVQAGTARGGRQRLSAVRPPTDRRTPRACGAAPLLRRGAEPGLARTCCARGSGEQAPATLVL